MNDKSGWMPSAYLEVDIVLVLGECGDYRMSAHLKLIGYF